jgi:hypothetical protein
MIYSFQNMKKYIYRHTPVVAVYTRHKAHHSFLGIILEPLQQCLGFSGRFCICIVHSPVRPEPLVQVLYLVRWPADQYSLAGFLYLFALLSGLIIKIPPEGAEVKLFLVEGV